MDTWTQVFRSELEHLGEDQVRARLAQRFYYDAEREEAAREWLQQKQSARAAELERRRSQTEAAHLEQAIRASQAAERAAEAAATRASIAIMIAVTAVIISVLSLLAHLFR